MSRQSYIIIEGEQKTDDWHKRREGMITGSIAKKVKTTGNDFMYETLAMMTTVRSPKQARGEHVDRGNELEPEARAEYEKATKQSVRTIAFIEKGKLGLSPDGLVMAKDRIKKLIEIKCPDTNNHIRYILEKKIPAEHKDQIVHGFVVCDDVDEIDFVSYDPKYKFKKLYILTVKRQNLATDIAVAKARYDVFLRELDKNYSELLS